MNKLENIGKRTPYRMPQGFNPAALMDNAIAQKKKTKHRAKILWFASPAIAAAIAAAVVLALPKNIGADPMQDYHSALSEYCDNASNDEMQRRIEMAEADLVCNMEAYEEYYQ